MKKLVIAITLALGISGCAQIDNVQKVLTFATMSTQNPVTREMLYAAENGMIVVVSGLNTYKRACVAKVINQSCRGVIERIQVYTRQIPPLLVSARKFVKENDQINARIVYNTLVQLVADARAIALANQVEVK